MLKTGTADLPLHGGKAPRWLFKRMVSLSKGIIDMMLIEYSIKEFFLRISDPFWFQALSCVLGYDWHSSGTTTVTCGALKEAIDSDKHGCVIVGGKGKSSRFVPNEIRMIGDNFNLRSDCIDDLVKSSKLTAKIDNSAIQDSFSLYHHCFFFSETGLWGVIQQGMDDTSHYARRYHWFSESISDLICDPHQSIIGNRVHNSVLNMVSKDSKSCQKICVDLVKDHPRHIIEDWELLRKSRYQTTLENWSYTNVGYNCNQTLMMPRTINWKKMKELYDFQPDTYQELLLFRGVGPKTIRALSLISDLIYGSKPSWSDPVKYSFTVGGKDGVPYPVDTRVMDETIEIIQNGIHDSLVGQNDKRAALKRLKEYIAHDNVK